MKLTHTKLVTRLLIGFLLLILAAGAAAAEGALRPLCAAVAAAPILLLLPLSGFTGQILTIQLRD